MRGSKQNSLLHQNRTFLTVLQDAFDDVVRLVCFVAHADKLRKVGRVSVRPEIFGEPLVGNINHTICRREDRLSGPVIAPLRIACAKTSRLATNVLPIP
jgi:hypothetical protein